LRRDMAVKVPKKPKNRTEAARLLLKNLNYCTS
jgi:hypothetical protein